MQRGCALAVLHLSLSRAKDQDQICPTVSLSAELEARLVKFKILLGVRMFWLKTGHQNNTKSPLETGCVIEIGPVSKWVVFQ